MNKPVKTKLCWNCEGNVSRSLENCPYCAVYLNPDSEDLKEDIQAPYAFQKRKEENEIPKAPYQVSSNEVQEEDADTIKEDILLPPQTLFQSIFAPLLFLTTGLISLFFALILVLFSENGTLTLQWNADFWYVYAIAAFPLLFLGWRYLGRIAN